MPVGGEPAWRSGAARYAGGVAVEETTPRRIAPRSSYRSNATSRHLFRRSIEMLCSAATPTSPAAASSAMK